MKILLLANHINTGGITTYMLTLAKEYVRRGHQVFMATADGDARAQAKAIGVKHLIINDLKVKCEFHPVLFMAGFKVAKFVKEEGIDVLHAQTRVTQFVSRIASLMTGKPFVSTCHGFFKPKFARRFFPLWGKSVIAVSRAVARHLQEDLQVAPDLVCYVPNGIDVEKFRPGTPEQRQALKERYGLGNAFVVGIIARLSDVKGHTHLIDAMNELVHRLPGVKCIIFGDGPLEGVLKEKVARLRLNNSIFFHRVNGRPQELLAMFDVFVQPSIQEGLGLAAMEAQACGIPVVASRVGGLTEAVFDGISGILVDVGDHVAMSDAMMKLILDRDLALSFSRNARSFIVEKYSINDMAETTLGVYQKVLTHA